MSENSNGDVMITGAENIKFFRYLQVASALALEINTGMKFSNRGSVMLIARDACGSSKRTKRGVLKDYVGWLRTVRPGYEPSASVAKAIASL